jgi:hypothetical protein
VAVILGWGQIVVRVAAIVAATALAFVMIPRFRLRTAIVAAAVALGVFLARQIGVRVMARQDQARRG